MIPQRQPSVDESGVSRRRLLQASAAGLAFAFTFDSESVALAQTAAPSSRLNAYVTIARDGRITIVAPTPEMGQATNTAIPLIIAEELDADWDQVSIQSAPVAEAYNHPVLRTQAVLGSITVRSFWIPARTAGAQARRVLMDAAAARWNVPAAELRTLPSVVVHPASGRRMSYGEIAGFASVPLQLPEIKPADLKPVADFRLIGKDVLRHDVPDKATGRAVYAIDVQTPGMVYGVIARAPVMGGSPKAHNGEVLKRRPGVIAVVDLPEGVAVVAERIEAALDARAALKVEWNAAPGSNFDSAEGLAAYVAHVRDPAKQAVVVRKSGADIEPTLASAARVVSGEFTTEYLYHAQMEPLTCVASVTAGGVEVWTGTQWPTKCRDEAAKAAGVAPDKVKLNALTMGGGFGRRMNIEYVPEAVLVSKAVGRPVKLMATRIDDFANSHSRPMTAHKIDVGLNASGKITGWRHRIAADLVVPQLYGQARLDAQKGVDHIVAYNSELPFYDVPAHQAEHIPESPGVRVGTWRGIGAGHNVFAIESMIDDLARLAGIDPVQYRLGLMKEPRARAALERAAKMIGWPRTPASSTGVGFAMSPLGLAAQGVAIAVVAVEVDLDRTSGKIGVRRLCCAADVGLPIHPRNIRAQIEGSLVWGLSSSLTERITHKNGAVEQQTFYDYPVLRMSGMPRIDIEIIRSGDTPLPVGELSVAAVMPAISNAVLGLTGVRLRNAPFTPDRVQLALRA